MPNLFDRDPHHDAPEPDAPARGSGIKRTADAGSFRFPSKAEAHAMLKRAAGLLDGRGEGGG